MQWYVLLSRKSVLRGGKLLGEIMILENLRILYIIPPQLSLTNVNAAPTAVLKMRGGGRLFPDLCMVHGIHRGWRQKTERPASKRSVSRFTKMGRGAAAPYVDYRLRCSMTSCSCWAEAWRALDSSSLRGISRICSTPRRPTMEGMDRHRPLRPYWPPRHTDTGRTER